MSLALARLPSRTDYVEEVYRVLLDAISDGSLAPGARLTQEEIAEQLSVSRSPVLQALRLLKKDGLVQDAPGRGLLVAPLDPQGIGKLYEVRGALDALAARLAAQRGARIPPALIAAGRRASRGKDVKAMIDADVEFHHALYEASGNPLIALSAQTHWVHLRRVMGAVLQASGSRDAIWDEHQAIADAVEAGDADRAARLVELHTDKARRNLLDRLGKVLAEREA
ncbi:GntR family transcriptional regulator [Thiomonas sp.]|jgi:DNA-binding GntR family transcriptional regulator|uniref:GntR family transcriptional regulator n=1 Tax=Thiomonas sp. TaxID=2047785 RepID=UPI00262DB0D2|nr:GntR family transcriptional regulator [Thiomonas sp.]